MREYDIDEDAERTGPLLDLSPKLTLKDLPAFRELKRRAIAILEAVRRHADSMSDEDVAALPGVRGIDYSGNVVRMSQRTVKLMFEALRGIEASDDQSVLNDWTQSSLGGARKIVDCLEQFPVLLRKNTQRPSQN